jgi:putative transposase
MDGVAQITAAQLSKPSIEGDKMNSFSHSYGDSTYHLWWITKYRYKLFRSRGHKYLCRDTLMQIAKRHGFTVQSLAIGDDHIHIAVSIPPTFSVSKAFQLLKGASSYALFRIIPNLRLRYPRGHLWAIGGGFRSIGDVEKQVVVDYVDRQNQLTLNQFI